MGLLEGKVAIVTGAGQGVGRGIANAFAAEGAAVVVAGRTESKCVDAVQEIESRGGRALAVGCDVLHADQIQRCIDATLEAYGRLDIVVNNAQIVPLGMLLDIDEGLVEQGWQSGPMASLRFMRACHPHLKAQGGGSIINLATAAAIRPDPVGYGAYAAVKEGIRALTRAAAWEWGGDNIRVNNVLPLAKSPGYVFWENERPEEAAAFCETIPLKRVGECEDDIGRTCVFLASEAGSYITGTSIPIDGGQAFIR